MILPLIYLLIALVFLGCSLYELILLARCRGETEGACLGAIVYDGTSHTAAWRRKDVKPQRDEVFEQKATVTVSPVFRYRWDGQTYEGAAFQGFSGRYAARCFPKGALRPLWVDPAHPQRFAVQRFPQISTLLALAAGVAFLALAVWCVL